jgi:hypothetical protein
MNSAMDSFKIVYFLVRPHGFLNYIFIRAREHKYYVHIISTTFINNTNCGGCACSLLCPARPGLSPTFSQTSRPVAWALQSKYLHIEFNWTNLDEENQCYCDESRVWHAIFYLSSNSKCRALVKHEKSGKTNRFELFDIKTNRNLSLNFKSNVFDLEMAVIGWLNMLVLKIFRCFFTGSV